MFTEEQAYSFASSQKNNKVSRSKIYKETERYVLKFGGEVATDEQAVFHIAEQVLALSADGHRDFIIIHGGGMQIDKALKARHIPIRKHSDTNERITDQKTLGICDEALGALNKRIVAIFKRAAHACSIKTDKVIGVAGYHHNIILGKAVGQDGEDHTGLVVSARGRWLEQQLDTKKIVIVNPMSLNQDADYTERRLNMNADDVALHIALAVRAQALIFCSSMPGVLDKDRQLIGQLSIDEALALIDSKVICGGMIPKVHSALRAANNLVCGSTILDGRSMNAILDSVTRGGNSRGTTGTRFIARANGYLPELQ